MAFGWLKKGVNAVGDFVGFSKPDTSGLKNDLAENTARRKDFADQYAGYQSRQAPQQTRVDMGPARQAAASAGMIQQRSDGPGFMMATNSERASVAPAAQATTQQSQGATAGNVQINQQPQGEMRAGQVGAIQDLAAAAHGKVPSAAEIQGDQARDKNFAQQYAAAQLAHGDVGAAQRNMGANIAQINQESAGQAAALRAQEQAGARTALAGALQGARAQDLGLASDQAGLTQGANLTNAQLQNQTAGLNAQLGTNTSIANMGQANDINKFGAGLAQQNNQFNAGQMTDVQKYLTGLAQQNNQFNAGQGNDMTKFGVGQANDVNKFNTGQSNEMIGQQGKMDLQVGQNNLQSQLDMTRMDDATKQSILNFISQSMGQGLAGEGTLIGGQQAANQNRWKQIGEILKGGGQAAGNQALSGMGGSMMGSGGAAAAAV